MINAVANFKGLISARFQNIHKYLLMLTILLMPLFAQAEQYRKVLIFPDSPQELIQLQQGGLGLDHLHKEDGGLVAILDTRQFELLQNAGTRYTVIIEDMAADYRQNHLLAPEEQRDLQREMKKTYGIRGFEFGSMGGYYTFDEVVTELDSMRLLYPNLASEKFSIGQTIEGREIWAVRISDNPDNDESEPELLYTALHHSREPQSMATVMFFMYYLLENYGIDPDVTTIVNNRELYFIPVLNPDGYVYNQLTDPNGGGFWRKNRRLNSNGTYGVDLNRNYGYLWGLDDIGSSGDPASNTYRGTAPFSEPETAAIRDFCNAHNFRLALNYHSAGNLLIYPWGYGFGIETPDSLTFRTLGANMTQFNNYVYGTADQTVGYIVNGSSDDWMYGEQSSKPKTMAMTPEVALSFWPAQNLIYPIAQENIYPNMVLAFGPDVIVGDSLDPNPPTNISTYSDYMLPNTIEISWDDPTALINGTPLPAGEFTIDVERDGMPVAAIPGGTGTFTDNGLTDGQTYSYNLFTRITATDSISEVFTVAQIAGGAQQPQAPQSLVVLETATEGSYRLRWQNPSRNIDNTPMDDLAGINLYEDGFLVATFTRSSADSSRVDSTIYTPAAPGTHRFYLTAIDNETPQNESDPGNIAFTPVRLPVIDTFNSTPVPEAGLWLNTTAEVNTVGVNPPSSPYVLSLDGLPSGGETVSLLPVDMSGEQNNGVVLSFFYQPQGSGNAPETGDSLIVEFLDDQGRWRHVRSWPGVAVVPFANEIISVDAEDPGPGASYFHPAFQFRFRNIGTASTSSNFDHWLIDDVFFGIPSNNPQISLDAAAFSDSLLVNEQATQTFTISNINPNPSTLNFQLLENPPVDWMSLSPENGNIPSNGSETITLSFDASGLTPGVYTGEVFVVSSDPSNSEIHLPVTLSIFEAPQIGLSPDSLLVRTAAGDSSAEPITITNSGAGPLSYSIIADHSGLRPATALRQKYPAHYYGQNLPKDQLDTRQGMSPAGEGGPDNFGYRWIDSDEPDGPAFNWIDISGSGTPVTLTDDASVNISLPFNFEFYGQPKSTITIASNGYLTFGSDGTDFSNDPIPDITDPNDLIAIFWDDLNPALGGTIHYLLESDRLIVQYSDIQRFGGGVGNTFQAILNANGSIRLQYLTMPGDINSATIGIENSVADDGLEILFNNSYLHDNLAIEISAGVPWLSSDPVSGIIAPSSSAEIQVIANALDLAEGNYNGRLIINSNDPLNPHVDLPVALEVFTAPLIAINPDSIVFDTIAVGGSAIDSFRIENSGTSDLTIIDIQSSNPVFQTGAIIPTTIPAGESRSIEISFIGNGNPGLNTGEMLIINNSSNRDTVSVHLSGVIDPELAIDVNILPTAFAVRANYPNPFNPETAIPFEVPRLAKIKMVIYNVLGQPVRTLINRAVEPGYHQVIWDGRNDGGAGVGSGIYLFLFEADGFRKVGKMTLLK